MGALERSDILPNFIKLTSGSSTRVRATWLRSHNTEVEEQRGWATAKVTFISRKQREDRQLA